MATTNRIAVSIYKIDLDRLDEDERVDPIQTIADKIEDYTEETVGMEIPKEYTVRIFSAYSNDPPGWRKFLEPVLANHSTLKKCKNIIHSYIAFIQYKDELYAVVGGLAWVTIEQYAVHNFGLEILVRLFEKNSKVIKSIQERGVTGVVLGQRKFYRGDQRISDEDSFGKIFNEVKAELSKDILTKTFKLPKGSLNREVSGCLAKSSFQITKAIDFKTVLSLVKELSRIIDKIDPKYTLNSVVLISRRGDHNKELRERLLNKFMDDIYQACKNNKRVNVDFCHRDFEKYLTAAKYRMIVEGEKPIESTTPFTIDYLITELKKIKNQYIDLDETEFKFTFLLRPIETRDGSGFTTTKGNLIDHLHGETILDGRNYFFIDGEWYRILPEFIKELNEECEDVLKEAWDPALIPEIFDITQREGQFNLSFLNKPGYYVFDTVTPEGIEACDILKSAGQNVFLIHVKKGFDNSVRELVSQITIAANRIRQDVKSGYKYLKDLQAMAEKKTSKLPISKGWEPQKFPQKGIYSLFEGKNFSEIIFCLAFADTAGDNRLLKGNVAKFDSSIAKYSLMDLGRRLRSWGFGYKVVQLKRE